MDYLDRLWRVATLRFDSWSRDPLPLGIIACYFVSIAWLVGVARWGHNFSIIFYRPNELCPRVPFA